MVYFSIRSYLKILFVVSMVLALGACSVVPASTERTRTGETTAFALPNVYLCVLAWCDASNKDETDETE